MKKMHVEVSVWPARRPEGGAGVSDTESAMDVCRRAYQAWRRTHGTLSLEDDARARDEPPDSEGGDTPLRPPVSPGAPPASALPDWWGK